MTDEALAQAGDLLDEAARLVGQSSPDHERIMEIDIAFHRIIAAHAGNPVLVGLIEAFAGRTIRGRLWRSLHEEGADRRTHDEHVAILKALLARDPERARTRMANHLIGVEESLQGYPTTLTRPPSQSTPAYAGALSATSTVPGAGHDREIPTPRLAVTARRAPRRCSRSSPPPGRRW
ncbi:FCD domain-containing protein [Micromonospora sp. M12]